MILPLDDVDDGLQGRQRAAQLMGSVGDEALLPERGVLQPIWTEKTETASRVRGRIEAVLAWASAAVKS